MRFKDLLKIRISFDEKKQWTVHTEFMSGKDSAKPETEGAKCQMSKVFRNKYRKIKKKVTIKWRNNL